MDSFLDIASHVRSARQSHQRRDPPGHFAVIGRARRVRARYGPTLTVLGVPRRSAVHDGRYGVDAGRPMAVGGPADEGRPDAAAACRGGHVRVNDRPAKPATTVSPGDEVRALVGDTDADRRGGSGDPKTGRSCRRRDLLSRSNPCATPDFCGDGGGPVIVVPAGRQSRDRRVLDKWRASQG